MVKHGYSHRYYRKEKYEASIGAFVIGSIFVFVGILAILFWRFRINFIGLRYWGYWLFIPGFFIFIGGFHQIYVNHKYKETVRNAIFQRGNQVTHKLEDISVETGIPSDIILRILLDLRNKGIIKYRFNSESGEIILGESITYSPTVAYTAPPKKVETTLQSSNKSYCIYCGQELEGDSKFCPYCGSIL